MKLIGAGLAAISISGSGAGIGILFSGFLTAYSKNEKLEQKLFTYTLLGFALTEAIALFGLMISFIYYSIYFLIFFFIFEFIYERARPS